MGHQTCQAMQLVKCYVVGVSSLPLANEDVIEHQVLVQKALQGMAGQCAPTAGADAAVSCRMYIDYLHRMP